MQTRARLPKDNKNGMGELAAAGFVNTRQNINTSNTILSLTINYTLSQLPLTHRKSYGLEQRANEG